MCVYIQYKREYSQLNTQKIAFAVAETNPAITVIKLREIHKIIHNMVLSKDNCKSHGWCDALQYAHHIITNESFNCVS